MKKGLSRRNLFKYMGLGGVTAVAAGCEQKPEKLIPMLVPPNDFEYTPQTAYQYMTTCRECEARCGMMVTVRENRAQKAEGNPLHPLNNGALCARGQASMQNLYNPERVAQPGSGRGDARKSVLWEDALKQFVNKVRSANGKVVYLGKPTSGSEGRFLDEWLKSVGGGSRIEFSLLNQNAQREANHLAFGRRDLPELHFEEAKLLLNFSSDFLETWGNPVEQARRFTDMHAYEGKDRHRFLHIGPHISLTGAKADRWVQIQPGSEALVALAIASVIREKQGSHAWLAPYLGNYSPAKVADATGVSAEKITELAEDVMEHSPSLALGGSSIAATKDGLALHNAVNILNTVAGNLNKTVRFNRASGSASSSHGDVVSLINDLNAGKVKLLIVDDSNPAYALPASFGFSAAAGKTFVVSLASLQSETEHAADLVLPALTAYETWGDATPRPGLYSIQQPVMAPVNIFDARGREDVLIATAQQVNPQAFPDSASYLDYLRNAWQDVQQAVGDSQNFENFWISALESGGVFQSSLSSRVSLRRRVTQVQASAANVGGSGLVLLPSPSLFMGDGSGANKPWLQETPNPISQIVWDSWVEINPDTAQKLGITDRELVMVKTAQGEVRATAYYHFGIHRDAIAIPLGQGHQHSGKSADRYGVNVLDLLPATLDESGSMAFVSTRAEIAGTGERSYTVNMDGNARQLGRDIAAATTVEELHDGGHHEAEHRPQEIVEFYPDRAETAGYYQPSRWGMTIDLDRCNGCSACVVACYSENNIPVVGKERTAIGREMSWLRMERYIEGYGDDFETRMVPMLCQQCGNAGCEVVCPVYATYHNPEGINAMIYNRCVGTRYCSNNCAYKVRRFNWFNYEFPAPLDQQLNTSITTRDVGVMEKCNFCIGRITDAKHQAQELGRDVQDGELVSACQQTCPTQAITFGNLMDPDSKVSKLAMRDEQEKRDRQYEVMPELNYKPAITYLKKVNTREVQGLHGEDKGSEHNSDESHS
ncbi:MAG: 4Fe-4S dicluster domain-containing protein [SAR324 cluster bacterium]|nr:4Fe-4S dicluster domain-containing protein [SAR324 cluster bacterium]